MVVILIAVIVVFTILTQGKLLLPQNLNNLIGQNAYVIILAVGMLFCILTGGNVDLSVGSIVCLVGALAGILVVQVKMNIILAMLICIAAAILIGAFQGFWIAYVHIPPFITTLAGMMIWRGLANVLLGGQTISPFPESYNAIFNNFLVNPFGGKYNWMCLLLGIVGAVLLVALSIKNRVKAARRNVHQGSNTGFVIKMVLVFAAIVAVAARLAEYKGFPLILIYLLVIILLYNYYASKCVAGRYFYAVGGNEKAARLSGIDTRMVYFKAYVNMGFLSGIASLMCVARFNSAAPTAGTNYELDAIGAAFIGGASAYGGIGTVSGVVIGAIFMGVLNNGMSIYGIDANWQKIVKGAVLLAAVIFDVVSKNKESAS